MDWSQLLPYFQILLSGLLGGFIGMEREHVGKAAGMRTYSLVAMGSTLFTLISIRGFENIEGNLDPSRIAGQVVMGIGFLGAGLIMHHGVRVKGLTTAAALWTVAAIGIAVGIGWYFEAVFTTLVVFFVLFILGRLFKAG